jgi:glucosamine--fructose-6-phosphate aminotransferase (isomerizing)
MIRRASVRSKAGSSSAAVPSKLNNLVKELAGNPAPGTVGIAHTRWATHGALTTSNAHPHATGEIALVHNGIIENFKPLREELTARGRKFESETDTEVVAHLVSEQVEAGKSPEEAVKAVLPELRGAFALAIAFRQHPDLLIGARLSSPLVVGYGEGETYLARLDALASAADAEDFLSRRGRLGRHSPATGRRSMTRRTIR